jgi:sulfite exporter TauE/SafE
LNPFSAIITSFFFGLLHGVLPDEHTWPITFSYAIGSASGKQGMRAGLFFAGAFTVQRALLSEAAYLALAPILLSPRVNGIVYIVVGLAMTIAGSIVLKKNRYPHFHFLGRHLEKARKAGRLAADRAGRSGETAVPAAAPPPVRWTIVHGFIAGFGFGGFSLFVNTVAAPAMRSPWVGFLPGLFFGFGTMITLVVIGFLFGVSLRWTHALNEREIQRIGAQTGGRTLFFGGLLFAFFGIAALLGLDRYLPLNSSYVLIGVFLVTIAVPAFIYSLKEVLAMRGK